MDQFPKSVHSQNTQNGAFVKSSFIYAAIQKLIIVFSKWSIFLKSSLVICRHTTPDRREIGKDLDRCGKHTPKFCRTLKASLLSNITF